MKLYINPFLSDLQQISFNFLKNNDEIREFRKNRIESSSIPLENNLIMRRISVEEKEKEISKNS